MRNGIQNGTEVSVSHEMGTELGVVVGRTRGDDAPRYDVRFADGTISSWAAGRVAPLQPLEYCASAHPAHFARIGCGPCLDEELAR